MHINKPVFGHIVPCTAAIQAGAGKTVGASPRATSPFNIKARVKRRREKRLEKQANLTIGLDDCQNPVYPGPDYCHQLSPGLPVGNGGEGRTSPASRTSPCLTPVGAASPCRLPLPSGISTCHIHSKIINLSTI